MRRAILITLAAAILAATGWAASWALGTEPAHPRLLLDEERSSILNLPNRTPAQAAADAAHRRLLAQEGYYSTWTYGNTSAPAPAEPGGQPGWLTPALGVLAAVLALVAGVAVLAARRANRSHRASQTA